MSRFRKGESGNPAGRPRGSRNKLSEAFCGELLKVWEEGGSEALRRVAKEDPATFLRVVASLVPKEVDVGLRKASADELTDDELAALVSGSVSENEPV